MDRIKKAFIDFLKNSFIKEVLKRLLGSATIGGFKAWLVKYIATELFEEIAEPVVKLLIRKGQLVYDKTEGNIKISKVRRAIDEDNDDDYWDNIGGV